MLIDTNSISKKLPIVGRLVRKPQIDLAPSWGLLSTGRSDRIWAPILLVRGTLVLHVCDLIHFWLECLLSALSILVWQCRYVACFSEAHTPGRTFCSGRDSTFAGQCRCMIVDAWATPNVSNTRQTWATHVLSRIRIVCQLMHMISSGAGFSGPSIGEKTQWFR